MLNSEVVVGVLKMDTGWPSEKLLDYSSALRRAGLDFSPQFLDLDEDAEHPAKKSKCDPTQIFAIRACSSTLNRM